MTHIRRCIALLMCLFLLPVTAFAAGEKLPLQQAHQVSVTQTETKQKNGSSVYLWQVETAQAAVTKEVNALAAAYGAELAPALKKPGKDGYSWLYVTIRHSRTGLTWLSFMVQARTILDRVTTDVQFTTRTYDMATGAPVSLADIFPADSDAWTLLQSAVREGILAYYPDQQPDKQALENACTRESIEAMDFTLHGMSLVLHLHAGDFYPGKEQLIEVTLYYPQLRPMMTDKARTETDNLTYYDCVALTYDDGPNGWVTRDILNVLLETGERATFFLVGERMRSGAYLVQREHDEGHAIATHNYSHVYANEVTQEKLVSLANRVHKVHQEVIGISPAYARAPGGIWNPMARAKLGWPMIQWSAQGTDWEGENGRDPSLVLSQVFSKVEDGVIILMHDMKKNSIVSSERIIRQLQDEGYILLTVDELFAREGVPLEPDAAYWRCKDGYTAD